MAELVSFGVPAPSSEPSSEPAGLSRLLSRRLGRPVQVVPAGSYTELADHLAEGRVDFAWMPPLEAVQLVDYAGAELLLQASRGSSGSYHSVVFVRDDSAVRAEADLTGKTLACVHRRSASGYIVAAAHLLGRGVAVALPPLFVGSHAAVVAAVAEGRAEAGATFATVEPGPEGAPRVVAAGYDETPGPPPAPMRPVAVAGPVPPDAICAWAGASRASRRALVAALRAASADPTDAVILSATFGTSRFVEPDRSRYELLTPALASLRRALRAEDHQGGAGS